MFTRRALRILAASTLLAYLPCKADVPPPLAAPPVPTDYCGTLYNEMQSDLQAFAIELQTPPAWTPVSGGPTVYSATLPWANPNTGPQMSTPGYLSTAIAQLQAMKALGVQAVSIPILFPILYEPFWGSQAAMQPYLTFYESLAQAAHGLGLKVIVDSEIMFSSDIQAGFTNMNGFYSGLTWPQYMAARATMAATIAGDPKIKPDFLILSNEPDTESVQTGQTNLNNPADAAQIIAGEIAAVQALNLATPPKLGAGFGTWLPLTGQTSMVNYATAYLAIVGLDYIDYHLLPVNTVNNDNFLDNALTLGSMAAAAGKPLAVGQAWLSKVAASEEAGGYDVSNLDVQRSRQTFSFWEPLDAYYMQVMQTLANYEQFLYLDLEQSFYLSAYQPYGGTVANGGAANCTCTTSSCSDYSIMATENPLAVAADSASIYTGIAFSYYNQLVTTPDTTPPTQPTHLTGTAGFTTANLSWSASTDNIGVAGYNVYRCTPSAPGQSCTGVWIANANPGCNIVAPATVCSVTFSDSGLTAGGLYNYQVQAFDFVNNHSPLSTVLPLQTFLTSGSAATNLVATTVSAQEITLSWSAPTNPTGLSQYQIYSGSSPSNLQQVAVRGSTQTTYTDLNLTAGTTYYFGIVAVEQGIQAPMSAEAFATTLPLPPPPTGVTATPSPTKIVLSWQENVLPGGLAIASYKVYQGTDPGNLTLAGSSLTPTFTAKSLTAGTTYYFQIQALDKGSPQDVSILSNLTAVTTAPMPAAPVNVAATPTSATKVTVTWAENIPPNGLPISTYTIFRGLTPIGPWIKTTVRSSPLQFIDTTVLALTTYYYAVEATDTGQDVSAMSSVVPVNTPPVPAAPSSLAVAVNSETQLTLTWSENIPIGGLPITSYTVNWGTSPTSLTNSATRTTAKYIATGLTTGVTYYFEVKATDLGGDQSPESATVSGTTATIPAAPVSVLAVANSTTQITVTWVENLPTGGLPISTYTINYGTSPTNLNTSAKRTTPKFIATGLTTGTTYYFAITASDTGGDVSPPSTTAQATTH